MPTQREMFEHLIAEGATKEVLEESGCFTDDAGNITHIQSLEDFAQGLMEKNEKGGKEPHMEKTDCEKAKKKRDD